MEKVKPFPGRKMVKVLKFDNLVVERRRLSRFPAKMTLVHARALLGKNLRNLRKSRIRSFLVSESKAL